MTERNQAAQKIAEAIAADCIVTQALARFIYQVVEACTEHEADAVEAMRAKCEAIARYGEVSNIGDAIAALKGKP